ncbi:SR-related and CTD-associated factor 4-like [Mercenaria mercenaria]|uniref:SR-related and CTD-associated factor 4-like n=1 Tax=Mercenaria mercenaria TaxID=6596 RepID=UPI00234F32C4|nr:SR-related and CTD-associated factor 4-like [Mercenaria mercenaria]
MVILNNHSPMAKMRVLYIGSAVPMETTAGLEAIQGPLKERYPTDDGQEIEGIDAIISITNDNIQMQYVNEPDHIVQFPISSLTLCAAVRCVSTVNTATGEKGAKFVSLNDPLAGGENSNRPAIFTAMTRRTQGRKVLECHGFICASPKDALNLVKCASIAGKNYKQNGTIKSNKPTYQTANTNGTTDPLLDAGSTLNRLSNGSAFTAPSNVQNGMTNGTSMRLIPAEPITHVAAGPEFFEPVSTQGYFYSSNNAEVKKYNIAKLGRDRNKENIDVIQSAPSERQAPTVIQTNGYTPTPSPRPTQPRVIPAPQPVYVRLPRQQYAVRPSMPPPPPMPMFYGPPPPPMYARPRFFSPPPPRLRPQTYMMPPGAPPPMMAPPIYIRRPRGGSAGSRSRSNSSDSRRSRDSRSKTPTGQVNGDETQPKRIPNADESSEDSEIRVLNRQRPSTPPTDYDDRRKGERLSRRDAYEVKYGVQPAPYRYGPPPDVVPPYGYDYYVQPPRHGGYAPFTMYNPHARSRSMPGYDQQRSKSPKRKKGRKKNKKVKKSKQPKPKPQYMYYPREGLRRQPVHSDVSTDSFAGYHSEIPRGSRREEPSSGYQFYPPRDFRRDENQYMNERNFSKSIKEETRRSRDSKAYPTAYELNDELNRGGTDRNEDADFTMY